MPAGPATLAAKTGSRSWSISTRRNAAGGFEVSWPEPIAVASAEPAELQRATQAMADALGDTIRAAPEQWDNFKPIWPASEAEAVDLARGAASMQAGQSGPGPGRS